ncbi:hypothetical protein ACFWZ2_13420 [Streptomyces sp. NPDC059002]|uniref:hypothetical protein n=1 Tax=Streptomyces sp. NPDC059002 TaxID=3346690 RepID=UPI0036B894DE
MTVHARIGDGCGPWYVDASPGELRKNPARAGGLDTPVDDGGNFPPGLYLTIQAKTSQAVVITGVEVTALSRAALPKSGVVIVEDNPCGGAMETRDFDVDLAATPASVRPRESADGTTVDFPLKVSDNDPEQLGLLLSPGGRDVRFTVRVNWVAEGRSDSKLLDNGGPGYHVLTRPDLPTYPLSRLRS